MKIFITGSSGYLGSSFIKQYQDKYQFEKFSLFTQKIEDIDFNGIDTVLHCAALVHQKVEHPYDRYHQINVEYPVRLASLAKQHGVKQFVFISTIAVYGDDSVIFDEQTPCAPVTPYVTSKLDAEKKLLELNDDTFVVSIIRPPMVYGKDAPGNIDSLVKLVKKVSILPLGRIHNKRSFVYIGNLCNLIDVVIHKKQKGVLLASDDKPLSTTGLIELIATNLEKKIYLIQIPFFETLLKLLKPNLHKKLYESLEVDNSATKKVLGLENPYDVETGVRLMMSGMDALNFKSNSK
jgi:UDP-glucose 4-epimerase